MPTTEQLCTFRLDRLFLGVPVREIQEVIRYQEMTRVPLASPVIRGLINLRGQIVTALDLRRRFGLPSLAGERLPMNVVVRTEDGPVSLLVDEIGDVLEVPAESWEEVPPTIAGGVRELVRGVYKLDGQLLLVLDTSRALQVGSGPERAAA